MVVTNHGDVPYIVDQHCVISSEVCLVEPRQKCDEMQRTEMGFVPYQSECSKDPWDNLCYCWV